MKIATTKAIGSIKSNELEKLLSVENLTNGEELFTKVFFFKKKFLAVIHSSLYEYVIRIITHVS